VSQTGLCACVTRTGRGECTTTSSFEKGEHIMGTAPTQVTSVIGGAAQPAGSGESIYTSINPSRVA
jgi:hypothetical protein